jgi:serine/threonine protein phosphatase PrpC
MIKAAVAQGLRPYQEDRHIIVSHPEGTLFGVFDGHGSEAVSVILADKIPELWANALSFEKSPQQVFTEVFAAANELTRTYSSGSTASLVFIPAGEVVAHIAVLGDSPVIAEKVDGILFIGPDHNARSNPQERSAAIVRGGIYMGGYIYREISDYAQGIQMTRVLGDRELEGVVDRTPEVFTIELGNFLFVGSDGSLDPSHHIANPALELVYEIRAGKTAEELVQRAVDIPTNDNVTALLWRRENV